MRNLSLTNRLLGVTLFVASHSRFALKHVLFELFLNHREHFAQMAGRRNLNDEQSGPIVINIVNGAEILVLRNTVNIFEEVERLKR